jgi:hypothetical protein
MYHWIIGLGEIGERSFDTLSLRYSRFLLGKPFRLDLLDSAAYLQVAFVRCGWVQVQPLLVRRYSRTGVEERIRIAGTR